MTCKTAAVLVEFTVFAEPKYGGVLDFEALELLVAAKLTATVWVLFHFRHGDDLTWQKCVCPLPMIREAMD
jgi:hypothetical protein